MPLDLAALIIYALVIIAYLVFTGFIVWTLSSKVPGTTGRVLIAVTTLVAGLPPILLALHEVIA